MGYVDADGFLHLTDRKAFMIISGGVNIYPQEAENLLITHPKVMDCAVFGVPNDDFGEEVKAVVQPRDMAEAGPGAGRGADRLLPRSICRPSSARAASTSRPSCRAIPPASSTSACCATATGRGARAGSCNGPRRATSAPELPFGFARGQMQAQRSPSI